MIVALLATALLFGLAAACGLVAAMLMAPHLAPLEDGPELVALPPWLPLVAAMLFGVTLILRQARVETVGISALVMIPLVAVWFTDARTGLIPDLFTLVPLAFVLAFAIVQHDWWIPVAALVPCIPFAIAALLSRGRGMGWGDVKFVAFGGSVLGLQASLLAFGLACFIATIVASVRYRSEPKPVAFAPYLVGAVAISILLQAH